MLLPANGAEQGDNLLELFVHAEEALGPPKVVDAREVGLEVGAGQVHAHCHHRQTYLLYHLF